MWPVYFSTMALNDQCCYTSGFPSKSRRVRQNCSQISDQQSRVSHHVSPHTLPSATECLSIHLPFISISVILTDADKGEWERFPSHKWYRETTQAA